MYQRLQDQGDVALVGNLERLVVAVETSMLDLLYIDTDSQEEFTYFSEIEDGHDIVTRRLQRAGDDVRAMHVGYTLIENTLASIARDIIGESRSQVSEFVEKICDDLRYIGEKVIRHQQREGQYSFFAAPSGRRVQSRDAIIEYTHDPDRTHDEDGVIHASFRRRRYEERSVVTERPAFNLWQTYDGLMIEVETLRQCADMFRHGSEISAIFDPGTGMQRILGKYEMTLSQLFGFDLNGEK